MRVILARISAAMIAYGPVGVFLLALMDSVGIPLPAAIDLLLLDLGVHSTAHPQRAYLAALLAISGSLAGNIALFHAARQGRRLFGAQPSPDRRGRFATWFHRYGLLTVFVPGVVPVIPIPLKVFVISAGAFHTPFGRFVAVIGAARAIRYFGLTWLALHLGAGAQAFLTRHGWSLALVALIFAGAILIGIRRAERGRVKPDG